MPKVTFAPVGASISVAAGANLLTVAREAGVALESPCNSVSTCGKCRVRVDNSTRAGLHLATGRHHLTTTERAAGWVLACQATVQGDVTVHVPTAETHSLQILSEGQTFAVPLAPYVRKLYDVSTDSTAVYLGKDLAGHEDGDTSAALYGVVVDIGTTTLVVALLDLLTGRELASQSALNPQSRHAQDVLSRISLAASNEGRALLYTLMADEIQRLILLVAAQSGVDTSAIYEVVYSGNTCMLHLATGTDPTSLGRYPYQSQIAGGEYRGAVEHWLQISPFGVIYLPPIISGFVGADITSGILASQLHREPGVVLFVDIGTNGEMALAVNGRLVATSTAAGPAFEGMNITHGMRAGNGAIDSFLINDAGAVEITTIGATPAVGICGSGLLDIVGELVAHGAISPPGRLKRDGDISEEVRAQLQERDGKLVYLLTEDIWLSQKDIRQVQLAKGAIRAGIDALLQQVGARADEVDRVLIAGSFGYHLRARSLFQLGLLPAEFEGKVEFVGNTSKTGGAALLLNKDCREEMLGVVQGIDAVELADDPDFEKRFVQCLGFSG